MKNILFILLFFPLLGGTQESLNMTLLANVDNNNLPVRYGASYSDCWGFRLTSPGPNNGTEIAIIGGIEDIFFYNITAPANPVLIYTHHVQNVSGGVNQSAWREFKTYQNYVYAVSDEGDAGLLIFDLSNVPASVSLVTQTNTFWNRTHMLFIDGPNARLYAAGSNTQSNGLKILSLASPTSPTLLGSIPLNTLGGGYVHDLYVRNNIAYCSHGSLSKLTMYNMSNLSNISIVGVIDNYPEEGYNHSSWLNGDGNLLVMADETAGSDLKLVDISDPLNISANDIHTFFSELEGAAAPGSPVAHNPYIQGDLVYVSYYHDGVQVFDISNPLNIQLVAYYDTYPENTGYGGYEGCWGVYPFLPSGTIIASDMTHGLYLMQLSEEILGIDFISFEARRNHDEIKLQWSIANASFGNRFEIERSSDGGKTFVKIGTTQLMDHQNLYSFLDQTAVPQQIYKYRIAFIELDGRKIYSPTRSISQEGGNSAFKIINPVGSNLILDVLKPMEELELNLYNIEGRLTWSHHESEPRARMEMPLGNLVTGQYLLTLNWLTGSENVMVQVMH